MTHYTGQQISMLFGKSMLAIDFVLLSPTITSKCLCHVLNLPNLCFQSILWFPLVKKCFPDMTGRVNHMTYASLNTSAIVSAVYRRSVLKALVTLKTQGHSVSIWLQDRKVFYRCFIFIQN